jgi:hypothetical protein
MARYDCTSRSDGKLDCTPVESPAITRPVMPSAGDQQALRQRSQDYTTRQSEDLQRRGLLPPVSIGACTEQVLPNRAKQTTCKDGTTKVEAPDGRGYIRKPTGTGETKIDTWGPTPADRCTGLQQRDGTYRRTCQDGTSAMSWNTKAGPVESSRGPKPQDNYVKLKMSDGGSVTNYAHGVTMIEQKNGTRYYLPRMQQSPLPYRKRR